jgi:N-acetylglucosamine-6-sulfatase
MVIVSCAATMKRYARSRYALLLVIAATLFSTTSAQQKATRSDRPNILILLTDDQDIVSGYEMPLLRKHMEEQGTTFANAFVHTPICCPSRSSILSGRYLHNGAALNNSQSGNCYGDEWRKNVEPRSLAVHAQKAGYTTMYAGKYLNRYGEGHQEVPTGWK